MRKISILGATGSIGTQTLEVVRKSRKEIQIIGVTANSSVQKIKDIIIEFKPKIVAMMNPNSAQEVDAFCREEKIDIEVVSGIEGLIKVSTQEEIESDKKTGNLTNHSMRELPKYKNILEKYFERENEIDKYKTKCKKEALEMFIKYFDNLWD